MKKIIRGALLVISGVSLGWLLHVILSEKKFRDLRETSDKHLDLYLLMNKWVNLKQSGKSIIDHLRDKGYKNIAVYGLNYVGKTLINELKDSDITIAYGIDKNKDIDLIDIPIVSPEDDLIDVDAVIVTPISFFDEIAEVLEKKVGCPILSISNILEDVEYR